ncbi:hypothetical protein BH20ACT17_BH20ACT17_12270 [soil metagenome]
MTDDRIYLAALERALKRRGLDEFRTAEVIREMSNHVADEMEILAELGCDGWELTGVRASACTPAAPEDPSHPRRGATRAARGSPAGRCSPRCKPRGGLRAGAG